MLNVKTGLGKNSLTVTTTIPVTEDFLRKIEAIEGVNFARKLFKYEISVNCGELFDNSIISKKIMELKQ